MRLSTRLRPVRSRAAHQSASNETGGYDAFISYSHAVDRRFAPALQRALHRLAKPWYRLRALRVFRDDESLSANPHLWSSIQDALESSRFFVLLASPESARSPWVRREVDYWCQHKPPDNLLVALTDGVIAWDGTTGDFDWDRTTALPRSLKGVFDEEPRWIDFGWARAEEHLSLDDPRFRDGVADLASPLHGRVKDELFGEDVRQHRRTVRLARVAVASLAALALAASGAAVVAMDQRNDARTQQRVATARQLTAQAEAARVNDPRTALLLGIAAQRLYPDAETQASLVHTLTTTHYMATQRPPGCDDLGLERRAGSEVFGSADEPYGIVIGGKLRKGSLILGQLHYQAMVVSAVPDPTERLAQPRAGQLLDHHLADQLLKWVSPA
jgi:hypothetical protein